MNPDVLNAARQLVRQVVEQITAQLAKEVRQAFSGARDRQRPSRIPLARNFDFKGTLRANLQHWDPQRGKLYIESPKFISRVKRHSEKWQLILLVDQERFNGGFRDSFRGGHGGLLMAAARHSYRTSWRSTPAWWISRRMSPTRSSC